MASQGTAAPRLSINVWAVSPLILGRVPAQGEQMLHTLSQASQELSTDNQPALHPHVSQGRSPWWWWGMGPALRSQQRRFAAGGPDTGQLYTM